MILLLLYSIVAFVIFFFRYKKREALIEEYMHPKDANYKWDHHDWFDLFLSDDNWHIWACIVPAATWIGYYPLWIAVKILKKIWQLLNRAYDSKFKH